MTLFKVEKLSVDITKLEAQKASLVAKMDARIEGIRVRVGEKNSLLEVADVIGSERDCVEFIQQTKQLLCSEDVSQDVDNNSTTHS